MNTIKELEDQLDQLNKKREEFISNADPEIKDTLTFAADKIKPEDWVTGLFAGEILIIRDIVNKVNYDIKLHEKDKAHPIPDILSLIKWINDRNKTIMKAYLDYLHMIQEVIKNE